MEVSQLKPIFLTEEYVSVRFIFELSKVNAMQVLHYLVVLSLHCTLVSIVHSHQVDDIPIFVINVASDTKRCQEVHQELAAAELTNAHIWQATNAAEWKNGEYEQYTRSAAPFLQLARHHSLSAKEYALSESHLSIYRHIVTHNISLALVCEDDAVFVKNFRTKFGYLLNQLPPLFHWVKLEYCRRVSETCQLQDIVEIRQGMGGPCTAAYLISREGASYLIQAQTPIKMNSDGIMDPAHLRAFGMSVPICFHAYPPLAWQRERLSDTNIC